MILIIVIQGTVGQGNLQSKAYDFSLNARYILPMKKLSLTAMIFLLALAAVLPVSCLTSSHDRGSLSDAMDKSRDDHEGDREVPDHQRIPGPDFEPGWDDPYPGDNDPPVYTDPDDLPPETSQTREPPTFWLSIRGGSEILADNDLADAINADILAGFSGRIFEAYLYAGMKIATPVNGSDLEASVEETVLYLKGGAEFRFRIFPEMTLFSPYITLGFGGFIMLWEFENALTSGSDTIKTDWLEGCQFSVGLGLYPFQTPRFRLGLSAVPEFSLH